MADVFISYSKYDRAIAEALADDLRAEGFDVWWDFQLYAGDDFHDMIRAEIAKAKAAVVIWSETAVASKWVRGEAQEADDSGKLVSTSAPGFDLRKVPINFRPLHCEPVVNRARIVAAIRNKGVATGRPSSVPPDALGNIPLRAARGEPAAQADLEPTATSQRVDPSRLPDFAVFREAPFAPEMVVLPAGEFSMGSDKDDDEAFGYERGPDGGKRLMRIPERFALGKYPVTFEEYDVFQAATRRRRPNDRKWGRGRRPVIDVDWNDANAYAAWLNERLGADAYRLPSEAQWEYACRAGTNGRRWWGDEWDAARANGQSSYEGGRTSPVDHFAPNPWGLHDTIGNVWEWCGDAWTGSLGDLPGDGHPYELPQSRGRKQQNKNVDSPDRALRGGSWNYGPGFLRAANRSRYGAVDRGDYIGFRLSRTL